MSNPFHFNKPTRPEDFLGRGKIVSEIAEGLYDLSGDSYGIVGGRRFGKTSLLKALEDRLIKRLEQVQVGDFHVVPVFVSLKAIELTSPSDVFGLVLHRIKQVTYGVTKPLPFKGPLIELGLPEYTDTNSTPASLQDLEVAAQEIVSAAFQQVGNLRIALLIDEIDCALDFPWTGTLFGMLRSLVYDGSVCDYVRFVLAGSGRYLSVDETGSPLINAIKSCFMEPFAQEAVHELVNRAVGIPPHVADEVMRQGDGHPFILQHLLYYLVEDDIATSTVQKVGDQVRRFVNDRSFDLEGWWYTIGRDGRCVYGLLAQAADWMAHAELIQAANDPDLHLDRGLKSLCYHGLAVHDGTFQRYRISGELFRNWSPTGRDALKLELAGQAAGGPMQVSQQAGANAVQVGQVSGGTIIIQQEHMQPVPLVEVAPDKTAKLRPIAEVLRARFDREEFRTICFNIGVNYDDLIPGGLGVQAIQLVLSCDYAGHLQTLLAEVRRLRPGSV
jgi:hypothetical protein